MVNVDDYSTETGLRVRIASGTTGTTAQLTGEEWHHLVTQIKAGELDGLVQGPKVPYVFWPEGEKVPRDG